MKGLILGSPVAMYWEGIGCSPSTYGSDARTSVIPYSDLSLTAEDTDGGHSFRRRNAGTLVGSDEFTLSNKFSGETL